MSRVRRHLSWRLINLLGAIATMLLWALVEMFKVINSVALVNRISLFTLAVTFIAGWRADVPNEEEVQK